MSTGWALALGWVSGCGPMYGFELTSPDWPLSESDVVLYRMLAPDGTGEAGGIDLACDGAVCRSRTGSGSDGLPPGTEVLVWVDVDVDDWDAWRSDPDADLAALAPDAVDPRGTAPWTGGVGFQRLEVTLTLP